MTYLLGTLAMEPIVDGIPSSMLGAGAGWLIVCLGVIGLMRGNLVPKRQVDRMETGYQRQLEDAHHDAAEWRTEGRIKDQQIAEQATQLGHLAQVGETVKQLAVGLQKEISQ